MKNFKETLKEMSACLEAVEWVGDRTLEQAWAECERGDWMFWLAQKKNVDLKTLTLAKVKCARLVQHLMKDERSLKALDVAENFALGKATREELDDAVNAASYAYAATATTTAANATTTAANAAAYAVNAASYAYAAANAANVAYADAATSVAAADAFRTAKKEVLKQCADICREVISLEILTGEA